MSSQGQMRAMILRAPGALLEASLVPVPEPGPRQILLRVAACGVCRTDLHVVDGDLAQPKLPLICGHEVVGRVTARGEGASRFGDGQRVGLAWLAQSCGHCRFCSVGQENLCEGAIFTGYTSDGGYAEYVLAQEDFAFALPEGYSDSAAAPLMCAGLIGYRSLRAAGDPKRLGLYGFGAAAHIVAQLAIHQGRSVYAFVRPGDERAEAFALGLGAIWAGRSDGPAPEQLDAAIIYAPVGALVPAALRAVRPAGVVVCAGIHMSDIPAFPYSWLWHERSIRSVANLTRADGEEFLALAGQMPIEVAATAYELEQANQALDDLRAGSLAGAAVLTPQGLG